MVRAVRSPGSALKPFLYGLALDDGLIHSESLLADAPQSFDGYQPGNFQQSFHGPVSVSEALVKSLNVPAVEVLDRLGPQRFVSLLRAGGLKRDFPEQSEPNLSVILGGAGVTLENLVGAYTALARHGIAGTPRYLASEPVQERRIMSPSAAFIIRDLLESGGPSARRHWIDSSSGLRADADCTRGALVEVETARWPAALEPWLDAATRQKALPPAWSPACGERQSAEAGLAIVGVSDGEVLRRAGAAADRAGAAPPTPPTIRLDVRGHRGEINWLVDGRLIGRARAGEGLVHRFETAGRHSITALDDQGRYDRVTVSVLE